MPHKLRHHLLLQTGNKASRLLCRRYKAGNLAWLHFEIQKQLLSPLQAVRGSLWAAATWQTGHIQCQHLTVCALTVNALCHQ